MAIDANIVNFGQSNPTGQAISSLGGALGGAIQANKQSGLAENRKLAAGYLAQAFDDSSDEATTRAFIEKAREADPEFTLATMQQVQKNTSGGGLTAAQKNQAHYQSLLQADPDEAEKFARYVGLAKETTQEKSDIKVDESIQKEIGKSNVKRIQGFIDSGIDAADAVGNIQSSIELLNTVKTGGFNNASLQAKKLFGIESADEAELSANLGKNVLAQLKPLFGAAFTAAEGDKLDKIEAGFGKSTAGNKRLLLQSLEITERAARRGLAAAIKQGDDFTASEIQSALDKIKDVKDATETNTSAPSENKPQKEAPAKAIEYLNENPEFADQFKEQFGYLPEGF